MRILLVSLSTKSVSYHCEPVIDVTRVLSLRASAHTGAAIRIAPPGNLPPVGAAAPGGPRPPLAPLPKGGCQRS